jgi:hypothetical protein
MARLIWRKTGGTIESGSIDSRNQSALIIEFGDPIAL